MQKAKDVGVPVVLHTEITTPIQCKELVEIGKKVGLKPEKIVKHFSPPLITHDENFGLMPSVLAIKKYGGGALQKGARFLMETDYIDDLRRPGAVLGPKTVPKLTKNLLAENIMTEQQAHMIHVENPQNTYAIELED
jgi:TatD-related deoxyribonuclease